MKTPSFPRSLEEKVRTSETAVVVVDMQKDFTYRGSFSDRLGVNLTDVDPVVERLAAFLVEARRHGVTVVHAHSNYDDAFMSAPMHERLYRLRLEKYCQSGTEGIEPHPDLVPQPGDLVITKHRFSAFFGTDLDMVLRNRGIQTVIITGTTTAGCVDATAREGYFRDYYIVVGSDLVCGATPEGHAVTMATIEQCFGVVSTSDEIVRIWESAGRASSDAGAPVAANTA